jgi:hypothetical protein
MDRQNTSWKSNGDSDIYNKNQYDDRNKKSYFKIIRIKNISYLYDSNIEYCNRDNNS